MPRLLRLRIPKNGDGPSDPWIFARNPGKGETPAHLVRSLRDCHAKVLSHARQPAGSLPHRDLPCDTENVDDVCRRSTSRPTAAREDPALRWAKC